MKRSDEDVKILMDGKIQLREMINDLLEKKPRALASKRGAKLRQGMTGSVADIDNKQNNSASDDSAESIMEDSVVSESMGSEEIKNNTSFEKWDEGGIEW